jgi:hypothetical protein
MSLIARCQFCVYKHEEVTKLTRHPRHQQFIPKVNPTSTPQKCRSESTYPVPKKKPRKHNPQEKDASHIAFATQTQWDKKNQYVNKKSPSNK